MKKIISKREYDTDASTLIEKRTSGVSRLTADGMHSEDEYPGTRRYSPKVREGASK